VPSPADTVLRRLQSDVMAGRSNTFHPGADDSIQFHLSHGPARQAEVLRETLTGLFADDSTLEPRDVVVLCPDVAAVAPHVRGLLCAPAEAGLTHPGHSLRVQVVASGSAANPLLDTLLRLIDVLGGRVTLAQLGAIAAEPAVARKFGISTDAHAELFELLAAAGVRWGLDAADRARFGLDGMDRLTVAAGLDRLLLGVALDDDAIPIVGGVLPQDGVESSSIADVGRLAELVSRLTTFAHELRRPATPADWVVRLRDAALRLFEPHPNESWQLGALMNVIATVGELDSGHAPPAPQGGVVALGDVRAILAAALRDQPVRNSLGNGSLSVTTPAAARSVPHRVVCLVGIDDETFPRNRRIDGDDLSAGEHEPLDEDPHRADRQLLLDAVLAARDRLIVIGQHRDPVSNAHVPLALPLVELQEGAGITETGDSPLRIVEHPPVAFSPTVFATPAGSFDTALIPAATPVVREPPPDPFRFGELPPVTPGVVTIGTLIRFFRHPLRELLGVRCGLPTFTPEAVSSELPIEPDGLARWKVAGRMLATWQAGHDLARAAAAERARGELPAGRLGDDVLHRATGTVEHIATQLEDLAPGARQVHEAVVAVGEWTVTGTLDVVGHELRTVEPWLHLLLLQTARPEVPWTSRLVSPKGTRSWQVPTAQARHFLSWLVSIYELGLTMPLPLPPETSFDYARMANDGRLDDTQLRHAYRGEVQRDRWWSQVYPTLDSLEAVPRPEGLALPEGERSFFGTLARAVWTPSQRWEAV
jgi:exodeoxyribonuclease V gamma subunit